VLANHGGVTGIVGFGAAKNVAAMQNPRVPVTLFHGAADTDSDPKSLERACGGWTKCRFELIPQGIHNLENWHPGEWEWKEEFTAILRNGRRGLWKDIIYSRPGGLPLGMDANLPEGQGPFPAVIVVHGGGWEAGDKLTYVSPVLSLLSGTHFAWFSIDYRLTPYVRNEEQLEDLRNAIRYVRVHAGRFDVDPNAIAVLGESASGQMATEIASEPCSGCEVQAVISFYGVYDFVPWASDPDWKPMLDRVSEAGISGNYASILQFPTFTLACRRFSCCKELTTNFTREALLTKDAWNRKVFRISSFCLISPAWHGELGRTS
jgi:acetyl esterase/lipase